MWMDLTVPGVATVFTCEEKVLEVAIRFRTAQTGTAVWDLGVPSHRVWCRDQLEETVVFSPLGFTELVG